MSGSLTITLMIEEMQRLVYESPAVMILGPVWSAVVAGFAVVIGGQLYITPAGERYLERIGR